MTDTLNYTPGSIVSCRDRQWVILPSENDDIIRLRPLSGGEDEIAGIYRQLGVEKIEAATFPLPDPMQVQDHTAALLLMDAARLLLRSGAGPFRCLGRLSVCPRPYQLVPLLMALRLETVRLLIADDVGIGKTIEAGLIARELLDRGEIRRIAVLCPPHLCDQWQRELKEKFHIDAVVVRSGTIGKLERGLPLGDNHIFGYYRHLIVSLDYAKAERRLASFITHCPDFVIVDEAHTCTRSGSKSSSQQQRHQLVQLIAEKLNQHLLLLTATPHSGIEESFLSLLGLLKPEFINFSLESLTEKQREKLSSHFVQRRRADVKQWLGDETPFPDRESAEYPYKLSREYRDLFESVYNFARGLVKTTNQDMSYAQRRGRYWSALALIRCVMSSPAAAVATLGKQIESRDAGDCPELDEVLMSSYVYDSTEQEQAVDASPTIVVEQAKASYGDSERRQLKNFVKAAELLRGDKDQKLKSCIATVESLLKEGCNLIIWCRYIATASYVADTLRSKLERSCREDSLSGKLREKKGSQIRVIAITGELSEDEREIRLQELKSYQSRVLVATDCLSEGVNLQEHFSAVIHYDLPWNPNRLEQREGRIDRYGQPVSGKAPLIFSNPSNTRLISCLGANLNSITFDFVARQKIGGTDLALFIVKQLPVLPPESYTQKDIEFIAPRVLELVYTAWDMQPFAKDMGYNGEPFIWNSERRALLRAELDAYYAKLYGLTRDELRYILDPADVYGADFPSETFRVLKNNEIKQFGEYRTQRLVLESWDKMFGKK